MPLKKDKYMQTTSGGFGVDSGAAPEKAVNKRAYSEKSSGWCRLSNL